jgi:hypothetical protein
MCTPHAVALAGVPNSHIVRNSLLTGVLRTLCATRAKHLRQIPLQSMGVLPHRIGEKPHVIRDSRHKLLNLNRVNSDSTSDNRNHARTVV